jgi:hypothetical protein
MSYLTPPEIAASQLNKKCSSQGEGGTLAGAKLFLHKTLSLTRGQFLDFYGFLKVKKIFNANGAKKAKNANFPLLFAKFA